MHNYFFLLPILLSLPLSVITSYSIHYTKLYEGEITHELENIYDSIRGKKSTLTREVLEVTLQCIDHFRNLLEDPELNTPGVREQQDEILHEIHRLLGNTTDGVHAETATQRIATSADTGMHTYYIFFKPQVDVMDDGSNPLYFVYDLHELGTCLPLPVFDPLIDQSNYNPEQCHLAWHILLCGDCTEEDIREHFMFIKEESQPYVRTLSDGNLLQNSQFTSYFATQTANRLKTVELDIAPYVTKKEESQQKRTNTESKSASESISSVRVASQKIDEMMNLISELVTKQAELSMLVNAQDNPKLYEVAEHIENISRELRDNAFSISLIPIEKSVLRFQP